MKAIPLILTCLTAIATCSPDAIEVELSAPLAPGDIVARTPQDGGILYIFRNDSGAKPGAEFDLAVTGKHREQFSGGLSIAADGTLFFLRRKK